MNAPARKPPQEIHADPVDIFRLRCRARAKLWHAGEISLHDAVDELQHAAEASGLIAAIGQNATQELMVAAFAPLREPAVSRTWDFSDPPPALVGPHGPVGWTGGNSEQLHQFL